MPATATLGTDEDEDEYAGITELEKIAPDRVDGVRNPASGLPILLIKSLGNDTGGAAMTATETETAATEEEAVLPPPTEAAKGTDPPGDEPEDGEAVKDGASSDEDGDEDSEDDDDGDGSAEKATPSPEAIAAAQDAYDAARREWEDAEPTTKGALDPTDFLNARTAWNQWNTLGKSEGLDGTRDGRARWVTKHIAEKGDLSADQRNSLKDSDFAYVDSKGDRHLPVHDEGHVRSALGRFNQQHFENPAAKKSAARKIMSRAKALGIEIDGDAAVAAAAKMAASQDGADGGAASKATEPEVATEETQAAETALDDFAATMAKAQAAGLITAEAYEAILAKVPGAAEKAALPASVKPAGAHREPDGTTSVEQLEPDAGMGTSADGTKDHVPASVDATGTIPPANANGDRLAIGKQAPYAVKRMHDALCCAYDAEDVIEAYPALKSLTDAVDGTWFATEAAAKQAAGKAKKADRLASLAKAAEDLRGADPAAVDDARAGLRKAFTDAYPSAKIRPSDRVAPGSYTRPYLSAGHAANSPAVTGSQAPVATPPSTHVPEPQQFERGYLTAGHASPSPADHGPNNPNPPGSSGNEYYTTAEQQIAGAAMRSIHDHIASTFAGCCPMAPDRKPFPDSANGMGANNGPARKPPMNMGGIPTVGKAAAEDGPLAEAIALLQAALVKEAGPEMDAGGSPANVTPERKTKGGKGMNGMTKAELMEALKAASEAGATAALAAMKDTTNGAAVQTLIAEQIRDALADRDSQIATLKSQVEELGSQPDPAQAPVRGQMSRPEPAAPVEKRSLIDEAREAQVRKTAQEQAGFAAYMRMQAEQNPDPKVRTKAEEVLRTLPAS